MLEALELFAVKYRDGPIVVLHASASMDVRQDQSPIARMLLVLTDPDGETWGVDRVTALRRVLGRKAVELGLPGVSLTLLNESGPGAARLLAAR